MKESSQCQGDIIGLLKNMECMLCHTDKLKEKDKNNKIFSQNTKQLIIEISNVILDMCMFLYEYQSQKLGGKL